MRRLLACLACLYSVGALARPPSQEGQGPKPRVEMVFALDTTSSMGGLIQGAKEKIWGIISDVARGQPAPEIRVGLVAFRDKGDRYVTQVTNLSGDLDAVYAKLMALQAEGGGDTPENVHQALADAVHRIEWSAPSQARALRVLFLVGDAPAQFYQDVPSYERTVAQAAKKGIVVNAIRCGNDRTTGEQFARIAQLGRGEFMTINASGGMVAIATPYDEELTRLSREMDKTYVLAGRAEERARANDSLEGAARLADSAGRGASAARASYRAKAPSAPAPAAEADLVNTLEKEGKGKLAEKLAKTDQLPEPLKAMKPEERQAFVERNLQERQAIQKKMEQLSKQRADFLDANKPAQDSFDRQVTKVVQKQAERATGISYQ